MTPNHHHRLILLTLLLSLYLIPTSPFSLSSYSSHSKPPSSHHHHNPSTKLSGWVQSAAGEWEWEETDPTFLSTTPPTPNSNIATLTETHRPPGTRPEDKSTPKLPSQSFRPKQSLGQNFLRDGNTVGKIVRAFASDVRMTLSPQNDDDGVVRVIELGPGAGALTGPLFQTFGPDNFLCIEIDSRSVELLTERYPELRIRYEDVLQVDYPALAQEEGGALNVIGNLPYYITSQILFALVDASHFGSIKSATVTMQLEVAKRIVASTRCKDYGILSIVFQLYTNPKILFQIPPTVFYPQPKVNSALVSLHFLTPFQLQQRLCGVDPVNLRRVVSTAFRQRRKTIKNSLKKLVKEVCSDQETIWDTCPGLPTGVLKLQDQGEEFALRQELPKDWSSKRPEELTPGQMVEVTRLLFGPKEFDCTMLEEDVVWPTKVWRKLKHGAN